MHVAVGSGNPVKVAATRRVFDAGRVEAVPVESGVPEQPFGVEETARGARNRARRALAVDRADRIDSGDGVRPADEDGTDHRAEARGDAGGPDPTGDDLGVGVEGGVAELPAAEGLFLVMWAAVTDGDRTEVGSGPALRLPDRVARRVRAGEELGPVMDDRLDTEGVARDQGASGVLTGEAIDREAALASAVAGAAGPFRTDRYRGRE